MPWHKTGGIRSQVAVHRQVRWVTASVRWSWVAVFRRPRAQFAGSVAPDGPIVVRLLGARSDRAHWPCSCRLWVDAQILIGETRVAEWCGHLGDQGPCRIGELLAVGLSPSAASATISHTRPPDVVPSGTHQGLELGIGNVAEYGHGRDQPSLGRHYQHSLVTVEALWAALASKTMRCLPTPFRTATPSVWRSIFCNSSLHGNPAASRIRARAGFSRSAAYGEIGAWHGQLFTVGQQVVDALNPTPVQDQVRV